jgi:hypothetical protein
MPALRSVSSGVMMGSGGAGSGVITHRPLFQENLLHEELATCLDILGVATSVDGRF